MNNEELIEEKIEGEKYEDLQAEMEEENIEEVLESLESAEEHE